VENGPFDCVNAGMASLAAKKWATKYFPGGDPEDPRHKATSPEVRRKWNAFNHGMWMAIMTAQGISEHDAMLLGAAHELDAFKERIRDGKGNPNIDYGSWDAKVDMHNNAEGHRIGANLPNGIGGKGQGMPLLANAVFEAVQQGSSASVAGHFNIGV
jgi:hypothetical protein